MKLKKALTLLVWSIILPTHLGRLRTQPNIIVIIADDLGWNDVSFHGSNQILTPNIDALAFNGIILRRHYVQPSCTPSRTAFLTGRYPLRDGMQGDPLMVGDPRAIPLTTKLLPEYLQDLGYSNYLVGKWHVGYSKESYTPAKRGYDNFFGYYNAYISYFNHSVAISGHTGNDLHYDNAFELKPKFSMEYMTDLITERAEAIIASHDPSKPMYLQISHIAPHSSMLGGYFVLEVKDSSRMNATFSYIQDYERRKLAGLVEGLDESVGRVMTSLARANLLENSIVLFMADNGAEPVGYAKNSGSNYPLRGMKLSLFDGGVRGTACVYSPLMKNPMQISNRLFHISDWLPTLYHAAGGDTKDLGEDIDGRNQWPVLSDYSENSETIRHSIILNIDERKNTSSAISGRYKLLRRAEQRGDGFYGEATDKNREDYPPYDYSRVFGSASALAIAQVSSSSPNKLNRDQITRLREESMVVCQRRPDTYADCSDSCLFDIFNDPCEYEDLSSNYPETVEKLERFLQDYDRFLIKQAPPFTDPLSFPERSNGTWMPWLPL
ncbi:arylsulfatase B-like [Prorops nasuta]|uniref:arylsulfatase B-like n=1 Tax=Prorops nasuta TaxID=863751 RepID=UPI0034CD9E3F